MKLYIDDLRDPVKYLGAVRAEGMVWVKDWWGAKQILHGNHTEITEIHFDHYLGGKHTAGVLFQKVAHKRINGRGYPKLTDIYLHSSDLSIVEGFIDDYADRLAAVGVTLHNNSRG